MARAEGGDPTDHGDAGYPAVIAHVGEKHPAVIMEAGTDYDGSVAAGSGAKGILQDGTEQKCVAEEAQEPPAQGAAAARPHPPRSYRCPQDPARQGGGGSPGP